MTDVRGLEEALHRYRRLRSRYGMRGDKAMEEEYKRKSYEAFLEYERAKATQK